ncbi:glycerol-3-phosphate 1-O-acyltransferase PlsB [Dyella sp. SG609]|uniref:glycerol-3-phosphate 1-O-acyltransferase PlsB n=1 Tax=Dyella sp. SG609 TaxID=2587018 RepID=UPI001444A13E|nr:glycerol-3-phosphate 1-O-acyltransferase PlsB [Dyella sp. SG609]
MLNMSTAELPARSRAPWWFNLAGQLLEPWLRLRRDPAEPATLLKPGLPVCYVVERDGFSDALILERACREAGLPSPMQPLQGTRRRRSMFALVRRDGWLFGRNRHRAPTETLSQLVRTLEADPERDIQIVPVSIYVGRAPNRESGWFSVLFSENWVMVGRFRRLIALLLNGRDTVVHFSTPVSLRSVMTEAGDIQQPERFARKIARVLRTHFRRIRAAVIGPDLSHRRTVVDSVLNAEPVRDAIAATAARENISPAKAWRKAHDMAMEVAADYSHPVVRSVSFLLSNFWNKLYDGIAMHHFDKVRAAAPGHEVVYVPCHRSHADYLLLSYQLHQAGVVVPHIAAGVNLNLPVIGPLLRRGGAFFLRRSFKGNALYSVVFNEYLAQLIDRGVPIEYFIEGGRSRTGRLLAPRAGMLVMTVRAFLRAPRRPVLFQPVYIGYEKLMEGKSYVGELSGKAKEKESLIGLLRGLKVLRQRYGHVALNFGEPIELNPLLDAASPDWRTAGGDPDVKPEWLNGLVDDLAEKIHVNINRAADVNPINLLALALLATPKHAMAENDLLAQLELMKALLEELPYSDRMTLTPMDPAGIIAYGEQMGWISRVRHPLGDVLMTEGEQAVLLSYFRNNVLHLMATAAWVACCFLNNRRMTRASVLRLGRIIYPFIQGELFLPWDTDGFGQQVQATIDFFVRRGLLEATSEGRVLERGPGQDDAAYQLRAIARSLIQAFERYYITIAALVKNGPHVLTPAELENACTLTAQRLALLNELSAPEFFDKALFRGFIQKLRESRIIWTDEGGKLDYDTALEVMVRDARVILAREVRHSILKMTPGGDSEKDEQRPAPLAEEAVQTAEPPAAGPPAADEPTTSETLHERHVDTERHEHHKPQP